MDIRAAVTCLIAVGVLGLGCESPASPDAGSYVFLVTELEIGVPPERHVAGDATPSPGFDLDGMTTTAVDYESVRCADRTLDWASEDDPSIRGVDNVLGDLARGGGVPWPPPEVATVRELVAGGEFLAGIEITGVDSLVDDPSVGVRLVRLSLIGCEEGDPSCVPHIADLDALAEQSFTQSEAITGTGRIETGRLIATFEQWSVPVEALSIIAPTEGVRMRIDGLVLSGLLGPGAIADGSLGGSLAVEEVLRIALEDDPTLDPDSTRSGLEMVADLSATTSAEPCTGISGGYRFSALAVRVGGAL